MSQFAIETMTFHNPMDYAIKLDAVGLDPIPAGGDAEIPLHIAAPTRADNGQRGKSALECVAPQLHPKDPTDHEAWKQVPSPVKAESKIVSITARSTSEAPGVKALRDQKEAALAAAKAKAVAAAQKPLSSSTPNGK